MASKREVLELLSRDELLAVVDLFGVEVPERRGKEGIVDALVASRKGVLAQGLADFSRDRLKDLCRALGGRKSNERPAGVMSAVAAW